MRRYFLMDMRRLFRTRGFYIAIIVSLFFLSIFALASYYVTGIAEEFMPGSERMLNPQLITQARAQMTFNFFSASSSACRVCECCTCCSACLPPGTCPRSINRAI